MFILISLLSFAGLIIIHEFGHFIAAKLFKFNIVAVSLGFGPKLIGKVINGVEYRIAPLLFGGYVKIAGISANEDDYVNYMSYRQKPVYQRMLLALAGPLFNYFLSIIILSVVFFIGIEYSDIEVSKVGEVILESRADKAKIQKDDLIIQIDETKVKNWNEIADILKSLNKPVKVILKREGSNITTLLPIEQDGELKDPSAGLRPPKKIYHVGVFEAIKLGVIRTLVLNKLIIDGLVSMIKGDSSVEVLGPVGIIKATGAEAAKGNKNLFIFIAILSANFAFLNLLPFPALDGGRLVFLSIEAIRRKAIEPKIEVIFHFIGLILLLLLVLTVTFKELFNF